MSTATAADSLLSRYEREFPSSRDRYAKACELFPDGVTHDLRYLDPFPIYVDRAAGAYKWDLDGHKLIDYWSGHGALLLGHSHPAVVEAVQRQAPRATHPGACHELEIEWGRRVQALVPSAERLRFTSSGTEATMMALRLARIHTGKPKVLKFAGHFHGWNDFVMPAADPPYETTAVPGVSVAVHDNTVVIPPNDAELVERTLQENPDIGCIILEPTGGHMGTVPIRGEFLRALREITARRQCLLIFDEVVTGFRVHPGGAQAYYGITPDLTSLAKVLAGGLPGGCLAGRAEILAHLSFSDPRKMKHPGTFNANPLSAAAGIAALAIVATGEPCARATETARELRRQLNAVFRRMEVNWVCYGEFSIFKILPHYDGPPPMGDDFIPYDGDWRKIDRPKNKRLVHAFRIGMILHGVDLPGLGGIVSAAHSAEDVQVTAGAVEKTIECLRREGLA